MFNPLSAAETARNLDSLLSTHKADTVEAKNAFLSLLKISGYTSTHPGLREVLAFALGFFSANAEGELSGVAFELSALCANIANGRVDL